jgi:hypothetical protein
MVTVFSFARGVLACEKNLAHHPGLESLGQVKEFVELVRDISHRSSFRKILPK